MNSTGGSISNHYRVQTLKGYCVVELDASLSELPWDELQQATNTVIDEIKKSEHNRVLFDLSGLKVINSGMVASLLRIWKAVDKHERQFALVSNERAHHDVFHAAGLDKLWDVVETREEAAFELGVSQRAEIEKRELRILTWTAFPFAVGSALLLIPLVGTNGYMQSNSQLTALMLAAMSLVTGVISLFKDSGARRVLAALAVAISLAVLSTIAFEKNPISIRSKTVIQEGTQNDGY